MRRSLSTLSRDLYLFFIFVSAENVFSHSHVDANGNSTSVAAFDNAAYSVATDNQNSSSAHAEKAVCNVRSEERSSRASCSSDGR